MPSTADSLGNRLIPWKGSAQTCSRVNERTSPRTARAELLSMGMPQPAQVELRPRRCPLVDRGRPLPSWQSRDEVEWDCRGARRCTIGDKSPAAFRPFKVGTC
jgi:hypothetical protein